MTLAADAGAAAGGGRRGDRGRRRAAHERRLRVRGGRRLRGPAPVAGRPLRVEHWGEALTQGEIAGRRLAGDTEAAWDGVPGFWSTIGERTLKYAAWGDGFDDSVELESDGEAFTAWYRKDGAPRRRPRPRSRRGLRARAPRRIAAGEAT